MVASPLPDRDRRHLLQFYLGPQMGYVARMIWAGSLIFSGIALQLWGTPQSLGLAMLGFLLLFVGNLFLLARGYSVRPEAAHHNKKWEKTTRDQFIRTRKLENDVRAWDESFTDLTCVLGAFGFGCMIAVIAFACIFMYKDPVTRDWMPLFIVDAVILLVPHWITGTRLTWRPVSLRQQIDSLNVALKVIDRKRNPPCQIQPMFEMSGKGDRRVPIGARVFVRFPDGPEEFLGIQFQVALNQVQGTRYPYLYAVVVAKKEFGLVKNHLQELYDQFPAPKKRTGIFAFFNPIPQGALAIEPSRDAGVEVIVIRQFTTKETGYHTPPLVINRIVEAAWYAAESVLESASKT